jgi:hypothetical protein
MKEIGALDKALVLAAHCARAMAGGRAVATLDGYDT